MLLAKLTVKLNTNANIDREFGRFLSKDIARKLTNHFIKTDMMAFYPSIVNLDSLEFIVEAIGNHYNKRSIKNRFDWKNYKEEFLLTINVQTNPKMDVIDSVDIEEISFCEAAASMIYCYKQDDYLIPDSDPHDVMASENNYDLAQFTYSGRFLPLIKLWCDLVAGSHRLMTGYNILDGIPDYAVSKETEFEAFSSKYVEDEVQVIENGGITFKPFNKFYKILVSNRTMIPTTIYPLVKALYDSNQLCSKVVYTLDVVDIIACHSSDTSLITKITGLLHELRGSTLVVFIDLPNHFLKTNVDNNIEVDAYQREEQSIGTIMSPIDIEFTTKMMEFDLLDTDDMLDFKIKTQLMREMVIKLNKIENDSEDKGTYLTILNAINTMLYDAVRNMNLVFAYTDTMAYKLDYGFKSFSEMAKAFSIEKVGLSDSSLSKEQLTTFGQAIALEFYNIFNVSEVGPTITNGIFEYIDKIMDLYNTKNIEADASYTYTSLYGFRYFVNFSFNYVFSKDVQGNEYFVKAREKQIKELNEAETTDDEEKKETIKKKYSSKYGDIRSNVLRESGLSFFENQSLFHNTTYEGNKESIIELDKMIGLVDIKDQIQKFADFVELNKVRTERGIKNIPISKHMVFMGNPGTAKTTVAIQLAKILHDKGLIPTAELKHVSRDDLVGRYVGWTAKLVKEAIEGTKGGILFVDEAYSLISTEGGANSYGREAINTFVNYMDKADIRDSTIIIFAGYKEEMKQFIDSNPGLKSRIGFYFDFPDYTTDELIEIAKIQASNCDFILEQGYLDKLRETIEKSRNAKDFGNGRFVRNIFEKSVLQQSRRLAKNRNRVENSAFTKEELITITAEDFNTKGIDLSSAKKAVGFIR